MSAPKRIPHVILALCCLAATARSAPPLILGHLPPGCRRPLEAGDTFTLLPTRVFLAPSLADSSCMVGSERRAEVLGAQNNFYRLRLGKGDDGAPAREVWVYRSELEARDAPQAASIVLPADLARGQGLRPPAAGDTLALGNPLLYEQADLLVGHELLSGRQTLQVLAAENAQGFIRVKAADGRQGWLHRAELPEERRRPR
jgi:hypothetical protein